MHFEKCIEQLVGGGNDVGGDGQVSRLSRSGANTLDSTWQVSFSLSLVCRFAKEEKLASDAKGKAMQGANNQIQSNNRACVDIFNRRFVYQALIERFSLIKMSNTN